jgi:hypothetical protein
MKKFILLILLPVIISGCTLIPKKINQQGIGDIKINTLTNLNVNNPVSTTTNNIGNLLGGEKKIENQVSDKTAEDCLKMNDYTPLKGFCLEDQVKESKNLDPYILLDDEEFLIYVSDGFKYLENTNDCYKYRDRIPSYVFDDCLSSVAYSQNNATYCFDVSDQMLYCITTTAKMNNDPKQCANIYISPQAPDYISTYSMLYERCLMGVLGEEADLENAAIQGCQSLSVDVSPLDKGQAFLYIHYCFGGVADKYNKPEYCYLMPEDLLPKGDEPEICLSMVKN